MRLLNDDRPTIWEQASDYIEKNGSIGNAEVRALMRIDDPVKASKQLRQWVGLGLLVNVNPDAAKQLRRYAKPDGGDDDGLFS